MNFGNDYWHAMDRKPEKQGLNVSVKELGLSAGIGDPWKNIKAHVTAGVSHVEIGFMGMGKGSISNAMGVTPETISKDKREDIRQFAKINDVTLSTHASANAMGFAGFAEGRFSDQAAENNILEVKKAIEFAADTAEGGPVVIHTGEFARELTAATGGKFEMYPTEETKAQVGIVDKKTGQVAAFTKDMKVWRVKKEDGKPIVDKEGNFVFEQWGYQNYVKKAEKEGKNAEKLFYHDYLDMEKRKASAEARRWQAESGQARTQLSELSKLKQDILDQIKINPQVGRLRAIQVAEQMGVAPKPGSPEYKDFLDRPEKFFQGAIDRADRAVRYYEDASIGYGEQKKRIEEQQDNMATMQEFALERTAKNIAKIAEFAYDVEGQRKLKKKLWIAPENIFPEHYGSHPQELKTIILQSRKEMVNRLTKRGMGKDEARGVAKNHIKATFDVGHANIWRKYFKANEGESIANTDKRFKKWLIGEVKDLNKKGIIGHVHLADNFGYNDEHLTPGQGNAPIKEFVKEMKKSGMNEPMVVEPGAQGEGETIYGAMTEAWGQIGSSPIYRVDGVQGSWTDIQGSYFGRTSSPYSVVGKYIPSQEWQAWSETPIE